MVEAEGEGSSAFELDVFLTALPCALFPILLFTGSFCLLLVLCCVLARVIVLRTEKLFSYLYL